MHSPARGGYVEFAEDLALESDTNALKMTLIIIICYWDIR